jgi:type II secretory pathway component PulK
MLRSPSLPRRRAVVLVAVLIVIVLLSLAAYKYNDWMIAEARATDSSIRATQARAFATSGVHYTAALLAGNMDQTLGGNPWDNSESFQGIAVPSADANARTGRFTVLSLRTPEEVAAGQPYRLGVTDESSKINLNALLLLDNNKGEVGRKILMGLPNMTEDVANAILDWLDADDTPRTSGAENETYSALSPPYRCKNGPFDSLEELLLVRGMTPQLLFGNDKNRNGIIDSDEDAGTGTVDLGWQAYLTVYSREVNVDSTGKVRININDKDLLATADKLNTAVGQELADYIVAYRLYSSGGGGRGGSSGGGTSGGSSTTSTTTRMSDADRSAVQEKLQQDKANSTNKRLRRISSLWDLVNSQVSVSVPNGNSTRNVTYPSPLNDLARQRELLPKLLDLVSAKADIDLVPRININTASEAVLASLKDAVGLTDTDVSNILSKRPAPGDTNTSDPIWKTPGWLLTEANVPIATVKKLDPYITGRSQVYRFQVIGYFDKGGPVARVEAVVDANQGRPRIVYFRDISELGKGFDIASGQQ